MAPQEAPSGPASRPNRPSAPRLPTGRFYIRPSEEVLLEERMAGAAVVPTLVGVTLFAALLAIGWNLAVTYLDFPDISPWHVIVPAALVVIQALVLWRRWATTEYIVTSERVYARVGRLRTRVHLALHDKITDIHYHQGVVGRLTGYASLVIATAGGDVTVHGIRRAIGFKTVVQDARDEFIRRLIREEAPEIASEVGPDAGARKEVTPGEPVPEGAPPVDIEGLRIPPGLSPEPAPEYIKEGERIVWRGKPTLLAGLPGLFPLLFVVFLVPMLLSGNAGNTIFASAVLVFLVVPGVVGFIRLRFIEYCVTDSRVYSRGGIVSTSVKQVSYEKITDISYEQNIVGRILGFSGITINTAGSAQAPIMMQGLPDAHPVKNLVEGLRARRRGNR